MAQFYQFVLERRTNVSRKRKYSYPECVICNDAESAVVFLPCNHECICFPCSGNYLSRRALRKNFKKCPVCQVKYRSIKFEMRDVVQHSFGSLEIFEETIWALQKQLLSSITGKVLEQARSSGLDNEEINVIKDGVKLLTVEEAQESCVILDRKRSPHLSNELPNKLDRETVITAGPNCYALKQLTESSRFELLFNKYRELIITTFGSVTEYRENIMSIQKEIISTVTDKVLDNVQEMRADFFMKMIEDMKVEIEQITIEELRFSWRKMKHSFDLKLQKKQCQTKQTEEIMTFTID